MDDFLYLKILIVFSFSRVIEHIIQNRATAVKVDQAATDGALFIKRLIHGEKISNKPEVLIFTAPYRLCEGGCNQSYTNNFAMVFPLYIGKKAKEYYKSLYPRDYNTSRNPNAPFKRRTTKQCSTPCLNLDINLLYKLHMRTTEKTYSVEAESEPKSQSESNIRPKTQTESTPEATTILSEEDEAITVSEFITEPSTVTEAVIESETRIDTVSEIMTPLIHVPTQSITDCPTPPLCKPIKCHQFQKEDCYQRYDGIKCPQFYPGDCVHRTTTPKTTKTPYKPCHKFYPGGCITPTNTF